MWTCTWIIDIRIFPHTGSACSNSPESFMWKRSFIAMVRTSKVWLFQIPMAPTDVALCTYVFVHYGQVVILRNFQRNCVTSWKWYVLRISSKRLGEIHEIWHYERAFSLSYQDFQILFSALPIQRLTCHWIIHYVKMKVHQVGDCSRQVWRFVILYCIRLS